MEKLARFTTPFLPSHFLFSVHVGYDRVPTLHYTLFFLLHFNGLTLTVVLRTQAWESEGREAVSETSAKIQADDGSSAQTGSSGVGEKKKP